MRALYFLRVLLFGFEALLISLAALIWRLYGDRLGAFAATVALNDEMLKTLMALPILLAAWVLNELRHLVQEDKATARFLIRWPDYWKLKTHLWVSVIYAVVFACISIAPWVVKAGITTGIGLVLFLTSILGQLILAASVYAARMRVKELLAEAPGT